eukprot:CAMPEP_0182907646 /NCGR_PEP_ID=MMETSP0034_2-20130328/34633_1 /TAXON_ID=156128 /ORGANISM="Nephroselmis pyriformis, Strain CCMP717" /LENGTH=279 /DNA_ID=CAMNT_0025043629 /DNA_START=132 /DNA_END=968 /DNA_ORIENTATION=+
MRGGANLPQARLSSREDSGGRGMVHNGSSSAHGSTRTSFDSEVVSDDLLGGDMTPPLRPTSSPCLSEDFDGSPHAPASDVDSCKVTVAVRVRPLSDEDPTLAGGEPAVTTGGNQIQVSSAYFTTGSRQVNGKLVQDLIAMGPGQKLSYGFDYVQDDSMAKVGGEPSMSFSPGDDWSGGGSGPQARMYSAVGAPCLRDVMGGFNVAVFAYGQTGAGKSYTMLGDGTPAGRGLIPRITAAIFDRMEAINAEGVNQVFAEVCFLEIYDEKVRDLLPRGAPGT